MKKVLVFVLIAEVSVQAQTFFSEDFLGATINTNLIVPDDYTVGNGKIGASGQRLAYVRTTETTYNTVNFKVGITIHLDNASQAVGIAFVGIGSGLPDPSWSYQPMYAGYSLAQPSSWGSGGFGVDSVAVPSLLGPEVAAGRAQWNARAISTNALGSLLRLEITKNGDEVTFSLDPNFNQTLFNPTLTDTVSFSSYMPFLNSSNSRIFFGSGANTQFSEFSISVPEPSSLSLLLAGSAVLMAGRRRKENK